MNSKLQSLVVDGKECDTSGEIRRRGWAEYFQKQATPRNNPKFEEYEQMVDLDVDTIGITL